MNISKEAGSKIKELKETLSEFIVSKQIELQPDLANYTPYQMKQFREDTRYHLSYLAESLSLNEPILFEEYIRWIKIFFTSINLPEEYIIKNFIVAKEAIKVILPYEHFYIIESLIDRAITIFNDEILESISYFQNDNPLKEVAERYLEFLVNGKKDEALKLISNIFENGVSIKDIYINVFQVTQKEVGRLWQLGKIFVAQEHFITAATQFIMSHFYPFMFNPTLKNKKIIIACINGELHEMGPRMIADLFELHGWDTYYLGANTPQSSLIKTIELFNPKVIAISATMITHVSSVGELISKIREQRKFNEIKILVGGYPFNLCDNLWKTIGADGLAYDFDSALSLANSFY